MRAVVLRGGAVALHTGVGTWRTLCSTGNDGSCRILRSPSLVSLDLIEDWNRRVDWDHQKTVTTLNRSNQLTAALIDGKAIAEEIRSEIADEVSRMKSAIGKTPGLAVILVGQRRDCETYVRNKVIACEEAGIRSEVKELPEFCSEDEILSALTNFNENPEVHGVLVQLPLPQIYHATVTVLHAFSKNPEMIVRDADIVVAAVGMPDLVRGSWLKPGAVVIDVVTCPIEDPSAEHGYRLIGDVCYEEAVKVASAITPVPGGVGPMTIAMLLLNTLESAKRAYNFN